MIIGEVILGERVSILPGAVLRADNEPLRIGDDSNVQENSVLHTDPGVLFTVGKDVGVSLRRHGST